MESGARLEPNGLAEKGVQTLEGLARTHILDLDDKLYYAKEEFGADVVAYEYLADYMPNVNTETEKYIFWVNVLECVVHKIKEVGGYELTPEELLKHAAEVRKRGNSTAGKNIAPARWLVRWKRKTEDDGKIKWVIKSRLVAKGFADKQKGDNETRSSTAGELAHKLVTHISVSFGWPIGSFDIAKAFFEVSIVQGDLAHLRRTRYQG